MEQHSTVGLEFVHVVHVYESVCVCVCTSQCVRVCVLVEPASSTVVMLTHALHWIR